MFAKLVEMLIGKCAHSRTTFPIKPVNRKSKSSGPEYVVCLDCGKEFGYDWSTMKITEPKPLQIRPTPVVLEEEA